MTSSIGSGDSSVGFNPSTDLSLPPPGTEGQGFTNLAVGIDGKPIGETGSTSTTGMPITDTQSSYLDGLDPSELTDISADILAKYGDTKDALLAQLNTIDPTNPDLPIILQMINVADAQIQTGNVLGLQVGDLSTSEQVQVGLTKIDDGTQGSGDAARTAPPPGTDTTAGADRTAQSSGTAQASGVTTPQLNSWLVGNTYVLFLIMFMEMTRTLMQNKVVQGQVEIASMSTMYAMAQNTAELIMDIAKQNQLQHIMQAVGAAISLGFSIASLAMIGFKKDMTDEEGNKVMKTNPDGSKSNDPIRVARFDPSHMQSVSSIGSSIDKIISSGTQASQDVSIATKEGQKEILQTIRQILQSQMDKSTKNFQEITSQIEQYLQALNSTFQKLQAAAMGKQ